MPQNKSHWYDGWFYDKFIAPNQDRLFSQIKEYISEDSTVIDIGCGTGRFSFFAHDKCSYVLGIDLSKKNIRNAVGKLNSNPNRKIEFRHSSIAEVKSEIIKKFDYALLTYVIHEVDEQERVKLLEEIYEITDKIIIGEYLVPRPKGFWSTLNEIVEFAAGMDHYRNFRSFVRNGGVRNLAELTGSEIIFEKANQPLTSQLVVLRKLRK